ASFPQPVLSAISPVPLQQRPPAATESNVNTTEADQPPLSEPKTPSARVIVKAASSDGYNWRKYGQKQVKSSDRSRSYYKCTNTDCSAKKKVEHCQDGRVTEITYRNVHNHDPPQKYRCSKEKGSQSVGASGENENVDPPSGELNETDPTASKAEQNSSNETPEQQLHCSSDCEEDVAIKTEEDTGSEPDPKRRLTESVVPYSTPVLKTVKEPKVVVQAASDAGLVSDGYRWRKYGQKIVKGNPNPRSYYRCTHGGCPVRKHVERASEDAKAMVITYEGKHNHDLPTPKNSSDTTTSVLTIAGSATIAAHLQSSDSVSDQKPSTESPQDTDRAITGKNALELGGEKALESAETLLSIGSSSIQRPPIFNDNHAAVPVQNS
ncbi:WRKY domain-containing protein, partial [Dioscorea alata]